MPAQLLRIVFPAIKPPLELATYMPHAPREMWLPTTLASLLARSGPKMTMPDSPERLMSLERILVPVDSTIPVANTVLSVMSLERILVPGVSETNVPTPLFSRSLSAMVVAMDPSTTIALWSPSGMFLTTLFTILKLRVLSTRIPPPLLPVMLFLPMMALMLPKASIPTPALPTMSFPTTVALRAPITSIMPTSKPSFAFRLKPRIVKPETLTSLTCLLTLPVFQSKSPRTQIASGPMTLEHFESALSGASITASCPSSLMPSFLITTSSRWTPFTSMVSPGWAAFMAFWMDSPGPTTELCAPAEPMAAPSTTPLATNRVRAMVVNNTIVRLIRRAAFLQGSEVRCVARLDSRRPFVSNMRSILAYRDRRITQMGYLCGYLGVACG